MLLAPRRVGISTPENELNAALTLDQRTMYFTRTTGTSERTGTIVKSTATSDGSWSVAEVADFSGRYSDYDPFVSPDGSRLFFISTRPVTGQTVRSDFDIWVVDPTRRGWRSPRHLDAPVNSDKDELYPTVASDGTLYFSSCGRGDSHGRCDLYRSRFRDGHYLEPENLGAAINTAASETDAYIAPDQSYLIFAAYGRPDGIGDGDLYVSAFRDDAWSAPRPLAFANTAAREYCPIVSPDGKTFYFTSAGDIYRVPIAALGTLH
jgi:dipeptidyl aminopeptidase/acylaminoacyl peptidase